MISQPEAKTCRSCGRRIEWRRKWARDWDGVRYCSTACRRRGVTAADRELEDAILHELASARVVDLDRVAPAEEGGGAPEPVRRAARRLAAAGRVELLVRGRVVDPSAARGSIQIRAAR